MANIDNISIALLELVQVTLGRRTLLSTNPTKEEWEKIQRLAASHAIANFVFAGIEQLPPEQRPARIPMLKWFQQTEFAKEKYLQHRRLIMRLATFYSLHDIHMMVLKGWGLSLNYPQPELRQVGDIDIYLFNTKGEPAWKEGDCVLSNEKGIKIEDSHEHHTTFSIAGIFIENHYDFINTKAHKDAPAIENTLKELAKQKHETIRLGKNKQAVYLPSAYLNAIFLMRHMGQHFAGERVILRQVIDWGLFIEKQGDQINWKKILPYLEQIGLTDFLHAINAICVDYLGFKEDLFPRIKRNCHIHERIIADIMNPEFAEEKPERGFGHIIRFKCRRWWKNRWKHRLVYNEHLLPMFLTLAWSHIIRYKTIKD